MKESRAVETSILVVRATDADEGKFVKNVGNMFVDSNYIHFVFLAFDCEMRSFVEWKNY